MQILSSTISARIINAETIEVHYQGLPENQPYKNGNWFGIWQGSAISHKQKPLWRFRVESNESANHQIISTLALQKKPYILGYVLGGKSESLCSTVQFTPDATPEGSPGAPFSNSLSLATYSANSLVANYVTAPGNIPSEYKNWIGLWAGEASALTSNSILARTAVSQQSNQSSQALTGISLEYDSTYTLAYANGERDCDISIALTFKTGESIT